jgi:hypothetical protein
MHTLNQVELSEVTGGDDLRPLEQLKIDYSSLWAQVLNIYNQQVELAETAFLRMLNGGSEN